jgi:hypothetical protein
MQSQIGHSVHIFYTAWKMSSRRKTNLSKSELSRSQLFSSNCPVRCGTSGYSYKRFVDTWYIYFIRFSIFSWHMGPNYQNYYPDKNEFSYYCGVGVFNNCFSFQLRIYLGI